MYHPTRGGTRGGQAEFTWDQVRSDQHRENYLGHSVFAPTGRWQNNKDVNWYNKDNANDQASKDAAAEKRRKELVEVKMREQEEMNRRLGIKPGQDGMPGAGPSTVGDVLLRGSNHNISSSRAGTGSNQAPLDASKSRWNTGKEKRVEEIEETTTLSKEDRRAARHLAKMQVREERRKRREGQGRHRHREYSSDDGVDDRRSRHGNSHHQHDREDRNERSSHATREHDREIHAERNRVRGHRDEEERERDRRSHRDYETSARRTRPDSTTQNRGGEERHRPYPHSRRDRSRSPGRSITPDMQRRRRD